MAEAIFKTTRGDNPDTFVLNLSRAVRPTEGDALYAAQRQRTRIVERTLRGVDVDERPFEPYSQRGPYYYYPNGRVGNSKFSDKQNKSAVRRLLKRTSNVAAIRSEYLGSESVGGVKTRSGRGIRFESYADFKASIGRSGVDLYGPRAPHMMQSIVVAVNGQQREGGSGAVGSSGRAEEFSLGIYGDAAGRAAGHNTGYSPKWKTRHQRRFLGASMADVQQILSDFKARIAERLRAK